MNRPPSTSGAARLVPAEPADDWKLFRLRNDPFVVAHSQSKAEVRWIDHQRWYANSMARPDLHRIFFVEVEGTTAGVVRLEREENSRSATISAYLLRAMVGRGIGPRIIAAATSSVVSEWQLDRVIANITAGNNWSRVAFQRAGYVETSYRDQHTWRLEFVPQRARSAQR